MATRKKKRSVTARKRPKAKRPAAKKKTRTKVAPKKAASKRAKTRKTKARKKKSTPKKAAVPRPATARKKARAARKIAKPAAKRARRRATRYAPINPQQQLTKVLIDTAAPSAARGASRGLAGPTMPEGFFSAYTGAALSEQDYADAAHALGCDVAAVKAVAQVETAGASFDVNHRPTILYERHVFSRNTVAPHKFDETHPDLSASKPYAPGTYGSKDQQFVKLAQAFQLDRDAALKAASWGKFQILGENYKACGFASVADFVKAMTISEGEHLKAFVKFLVSSRKRLEAIRKKDWAAFALNYNGKEYAKFQYDTKLQAAYASHAQSA